MYEVLILLVLVNLGFTSYIWRTVRRDPKRKFLGKLLNGKPITPNHTSSGQNIEASVAEPPLLPQVQNLAVERGHKCRPATQYRSESRVRPPTPQKASHLFSPR